MNRKSISRTAFASLAAVALAASSAAVAAPALAEDVGAASWELGVVLPFPDGTIPGSAGYWHGVCPGGKGVTSTAFILDLDKHDGAGAPIEGAQFEVTWTPRENAGALSGTSRISLESWEQVRDRGLEQARLDAVDVRLDAVDAQVEANHVHTAAVEAAKPTQTALDDAHLEVNYAQGRLDRANDRELFAAGYSGFTEEEIDAFQQEAIDDAQAGLDAAQVALDEAIAAHAPFQQAIDDATAAYGVAVAAVDAAEVDSKAAAQAISDHLVASGELDSWTVTTDADGDADLTIVGCGYGSVTITEVAVPADVDPAGIGSVLTLDHRGAVIENGAPDVFASVTTESTEAAGDAMPTHTAKVEAVNARLDEPETPAKPETPTEPEEPTEPETPAEPETPSEPETPAKPEEPVTPPKPIPAAPKPETAKPIVSG